MVCFHDVRHLVVETSVSSKFCCTFHPMMALVVRWVDCEIPHRLEREMSASADAEP